MGASLVSPHCMHPALKPKPQAFGGFSGMGLPEILLCKMTVSEPGAQ